MQLFIRTIRLGIMLLAACMLSLQALAQTTTPGNTLAFDGTNDYVALPPAVLNNLNTGTIEMWLYLNSNVVGTILIKQCENIGIHAALTITNFVTSDGSLAIGHQGKIYYRSQEAGTLLTSNTVLQTGHWYHIALTFTATTASLYINGVLDVTVTGGNFVIPNVLISASPISTTLGTMIASNTPQQRLNGRLDELRIFNTDRSAIVYSDMLNTIPANTAGLIAYYKFDQGTAAGNNAAITTLVDSTTSAYNGTLNNFWLTVPTTSNWLESYAMAIPQLIASTNVAPTTFTANWNAPTIGVVDNYLLDVSTSATFSSFVSGYNAKSVAATSSQVTGLSPETNYYYRVRADKTSVTGQGGYSSTSTVTTLPPPPTIISFTPLSGKTGDVITLTGTNFNTTTTNNIVFFGATKATVTAATANSLTVTVPSGATYAPITVLNTTSAFACYSLQRFNPIYDPAKSTITSTDFLPKIDFGSGNAPNSVAIGDLDGDGKPDLVTANYSSNSISVYFNTATSGIVAAGSFAARVNFATGSSSPISVVIGDLDGDGKPDLTVANYNGNTFSIFRNTATSGTITTSSFATNVNFATGFRPNSIAIGDLDGDGKPDIAIANSADSKVSIFRNISNSGAITTGSFETTVDFTTGNRPYSVAIGDLDGDGKPDLAVANYFSSNVSVFRNTATSGSISSGSFAEKVDFTTGTNPYSVAIGDLDGDGKPDLAVANYSSNTVSVIRNTATSGSISSGSFATKVDFAAGTRPYSVAVGDLDGNGKPDLAVANYNSATVSVFRNTATIGSIGSGSFATKVDFTTGTQPTSVAIGDLDGDGKPDLLIGNAGSNSLSVIRNTSNNANLSALAISTGTLSPIFSVATTAYTASVPNAITSITVTPTKADATASITINGTTVASGAASEIINLNVGSNTITVIVTAQNATTKTYTVVVTRAASSNANLSNLAISSGTLSPAFATATTAYTANVSAPTTSISVTPTKEDANASITVNATTVASGNASGNINLSEGSNPVTVIVTAENGTTKTYTITVARDFLPPTITSFTPINGKPGDIVTLAGTNFNTTTSNNIVFFGATQAMVTAATATSITVTVPSGATYAPITLLNTGTSLAAYSVANFTPTYSPTKTSITVSDLLPKQDFTTGENPFTVAIGDLDGDGKPDLAVANIYSNTVSIYRNTSTIGSIGGGSFAAKQDFTTGIEPVSVSIGDLDGDGKPDLAVTNFSGNSVSIFRNTATIGTITSSSFAPKVDFATGSYPYSVVIGDLDGDGKLDLALANFYSNTVSIYRNTATSGSIGSGSFAAKQDFTTGTYPISVSIGDLDGDGKPDLAVANISSNTVSVFRNTTTNGSIDAGSFAVKQDFITGSSPRFVSIGDLDGDGKPDLAVANSSSNTVSIFRNTATSGSIGSGSFAAKQDFTTGTAPGSVSIGDMDGDGKPDLVTPNANANTVSILRNTANSGSITASSFAAKVDFATGLNPYSVAISDLDGDGKPDLAVTNSDVNTISIFRNTSNNANLSNLAISTGTISPTFATATTAYTASVSEATTSITLTPTKSDTNASITVNGTTVASGTASGTINLSEGSNTITVIVTAQNATTKTYTITVTRAFLPPTITSFTPTSGKPGDIVTITGTSFNTTTSNNIVFFGATKATVTAATSTSLTVTVPSGATYAPVTFLNTVGSLAAYSGANFTPTYSPTKTSITASDFLPKQDFITDVNPIAIAIGDLDGDGKPDLVTANYISNSISVYFNTATSGIVAAGSFAARVNFTTGSSPISVVIGDLDGDGKPDLTVANYNANTISIFRNTATSGTITTSSFATKVDFATGLRPNSIAIGDVDGDGKPDIAIANRNNSNVSIFRNTANSGAITTGSFATKVDFTTGNSPRSVTIGDLDGDGKPDLAVANYSSNTVSVFRNTATSGSISSGSFAVKQDFTTGYNPNSVSIGDLDGDGKPDLAVANYSSNTVSVFRNTATSGIIGSGSFAAIVDFETGIDPIILSIGDLDGDGKPDLAVAYTNSNTVSIFRNTATSGSIGNGSFATKQNFTTGSGPYSIAIGDLDGDGRPDLAIANQNDNSISVLRNASNNADLSALAISIGTLSPAFATATTAYIASVSNATASITVTPTKADVYATFKVNGTTVTSGSPSGSINLNQGSNTITIVVTAQNGTTKTYTITVTRELPITITSFAPLAAKPGDAITITGTNFNTTTSNNIVFFGATKATVTAATATSLTVTVPSGATYAPITVLNASSSSIAYSTQNFTPTYNPAKTGFTATDLLPKQDFGAGDYPSVVAIGDLDGDGKPDMAVVNSNSNTITLYKNISTNGSINAGSFYYSAEIATGTYPTAVAISDLDGDGKPDMVVVNSNSNTISVFRKIDSYGFFDASSFAAKVDFATGVSPAAVAIGDFDGDGKSDLAIANLSSNTVSILRNTATSGSITASSFAAKVDFATGTLPNCLGIGDLDGDGKPDLAIGSNNVVSVLRNTTTVGSISTGSFAAGVNFGIGSGNYSLGLAIGDLDGDGKLDLAVAGAGTNTVMVYRNTATSGSFTASSFATKVDFATSAGPFSVAIGDMDGDGKPDLVTANANANTVSVLRNTTSTSSITASSFAAKVDFATGSSPQSVAIGDLDGDGRPDLAVTNSAGRPISVLRNASNNANLNALTISTGTLSPAFAAATTAYTASVNSATTSITVTPTKADATASITVNGTTVASGTASTAINLSIGSNTILVVVTAENGSTKTDTVIVTRSALPTTWLGTTSTNWQTASNWNTGIVPTSTDVVTLPSGTLNAPTNSSTVSVAAVSIASGVIVTNTGTFSVTDSVTNNGSIIGAGNLILNGTSLQIISGVGTISNVTLDNSAGAVISSGTTKITGIYTPLTGTLTTNSHLTLISTDITGGGSVAAGSGIVSGTVTVQRYTQAQRGYRTLSHPFTTAQPLSQLTNTIRVTGLTANNGLYGVATGNPSVFWYDATKPAGTGSVLQPITNAIATTNWSAGKSLYVFVRGNGLEGIGGAGSINYSGATISPITLNIVGTINQGNVPVNLVYGDATTDNYNLIGNPYPSPINLKNVTGMGSFGTVYVYNPTKNMGTADAYTIRGGFDSYTNDGNNNIIIPTMGGFYVKATNNGQSLVFNETDKTTSLAPTYAVFGTTKYPLIRLTIGTAQGNLDEVKIGFNSSATAKATDKFDAPKLSNSLFDFYTLSAEKKALSIDYRSDNMIDSIILLGIKTNIANRITISLAGIADMPTTQLVLRDKLLQKETLLLKEGDSYSFDISDDTATKGDNRFELGLHGITVLPTTITSFTAQQQPNSNILVNWVTTNEVNTNYFNVQRSTNASSFTTIGKLGAKGDGSYSYIDNLASIGNQPATIYYRLQTVDKDGTSSFSKTVAITTNTQNPTLIIYPNPVATTLFAQVTVTKAGPVDVLITDMQGKVLLKQTEQLNIGTTAVSVTTASLAGGTYILVIHGNGTSMKQQFVKE